MDTYKDLLSKSKITKETYWDSVRALYEFHKKQKELDTESLTSISDSEESSTNEDNNNYVSIRSSISNIAISSSQTNVFNDDTSSYHSNFAGVGYVNEDTASSYATASNYNYYYENSNDYNNYAFLNYADNEELETYFPKYLHFFFNKKIYFHFISS